jgi:apolipoprotein N-acyltransferase
MERRSVGYLVMAAAIGAGFWFVMNLEPVWWLAWLLPGLLFALVLRTDGWTSRGVVAIAAFIGAASNFGYFTTVMPPAPAVLILLLQTLMWVFIFGAARRIVRSFEAGWTVLALPVLAVAVDTLLAHFTPDGNFGSLAYTQADALAVAQIASVFGMGGILFVLMLANSALGMLISARHLRGVGTAAGISAAVIAVAVGFGAWRLEQDIAGTPVVFGIASVDDFILETKAPQQAEAVWLRYHEQVRELARGGASVVLLPEKIDVLPSTQAEGRKAALARLAREQGIWLVAGVGVDTGAQRRNEAWWFAPDGSLRTNYLKHFMAPPEREFAPGDEFPVNDIGGVRYGVAICKDMHFASLGREFGKRAARVMLVPAWDFNADAWMAANMTKLRGVESGFSVVRSSRNGLLTVSDPHGRMLAVESSTTLPGKTLLVRTTVGAPISTAYTRIGDALGWLCVAAAVVLVPLSRRRRSA